MILLLSQIANIISLSRVAEKAEMWIVSRKRLREYGETAKGQNAQESLDAWYLVVKDASWVNFSDVKETYSKASLVGNCVVFNILNNKYRLITRILYGSHKVFILKVMTHAEYDDQSKWQEECGCHHPPD